MTGKEVVVICKNFGSLSSPCFSSSASAVALLLSLPAGNHSNGVPSRASVCNTIIPHSSYASPFGLPRPPFRRTWSWRAPKLFSTMAEPILVRARDPSRLAVELIDAIDEGRLDAAWNLYEQYVNMERVPRKSVLVKVVVGFSESFDPQWLDKAYQLVESVFALRKNELLDKDSLLYLSFVLSRFGMNIPASTILRKLVEMEEYPSVKVWTCIIGHMSQTEAGAFLAAELVGEFGYHFKDNRVDSRKKSNRPLLAMKPNPEAFNLALTGCLVSGTTKKAEQLLDLMPRVGVKADADLLIVMAHIYERNGRIDEIKKLKRHVDEACGLGDLQFQRFYDCLLSCHLKFLDIDSASRIVLDLLRKAKEAKKSLAAARSILRVVESGQTSPPQQTREHEKLGSLDNFKWIVSHPPSFNEFCRDSIYTRLANESKELLCQLWRRLQAQVELVRSENGILHPTDKIYAKLVRAFLEAGKMNDLAKFLIKASKEETPVSTENSAVVQVINACISLQLLDQAHDLLDEMRFHGVRVGSSVYSSLLKAYCKESRLGEITALLKDAQKTGVQLDSSCYKALIQSRAHHQDISGALRLFNEMKDSNITRPGNHEFDTLIEGCMGSREAGLMAKLLEEIKDDKRGDCGVHDWNSVIHFFCKKRLMQDARKALMKMRALGHIPNSQTFHSMVTAYAAIGGKYVEVTDLWGEMKVLAHTSSLKFDQELLDSLLYCFVRGGFFLRANEVVKMMEKGGMFIDKYKYRTLWLKYHRTLYKGKAPKIQTEAQFERREAAMAFKKWINLT